LFGGFAGTTGLSDFPRSFIEGLPPLAFPSRPATDRSATPRAIKDGASSAGTGDHGIPRFSRLETSCMRRFFDRAGSADSSR